jgi:hypothetical protein
MREQSVTFLPDHRIALATQLFQSRPIHYRNLPALVFYYTKLLQLARGFGDALTPHPEHVRDQLLCHSQSVA